MISAVTIAATNTLRVRSAPPLEPPYDDEPVRYHIPELADMLGQSLLPCFSAPENQSTAEAILHHPRGALEDGRGFCRQPTSRSQLPEPGNHARKLVQALMEMIAGDRPLGQLVPWLHEALYFELADRYGAVRAANRHAAKVRWNQSGLPELHCGRVRTRVASVRICEPADGIVEISAVVHERGRSYAVALRMEGLDGGWRCTDFTVV